MPIPLSSEINPVSLLKTDSKDLHISVTLNKGDTSWKISILADLGEELETVRKLKELIKEISL